jgi:hypothetical protein
MSRAWGLPLTGHLDGLRKEDEKIKINDIPTLVNMHHI